MAVVEFWKFHKVLHSSAVYAVVQSRDVKTKSSRATIQSGFSDLPVSKPGFPLASVKVCLCLGGQKTRPILDSPALQQQLQRRLPWFDSIKWLFVGKGHVLRASISCCVGAACWCVATFPRRKTLHVCREPVLFSPSLLHHLRAGLRNADGLFSFPRRARQNPNLRL